MGSKLHQTDMESNSLGNPNSFFQEENVLDENRSFKGVDTYLIEFTNKNKKSRKYKSVSPTKTTTDLIAKSLRSRNKINYRKSMFLCDDIEYINREICLTFLEDRETFLWEQEVIAMMMDDNE